MLFKKIILGVMIGLFLVSTGYFIFSKYRAQERASANNSINLSQLQRMSAVDLQQFDGSDDSKPIYMAVHGKVYDVSRGREFYKTGGVYHYLAGKDSTEDLRPVGTEIITNKYPIIAVYTN
jgi:predicted heme/steroid binding protein